LHLLFLINAADHVPIYSFAVFGLERLHEARLERERIIGEHQLQQENQPHKAKQQDVNTPASTKPSPMRTQNYSKKKQGVISPTQDKFCVTSASLPPSSAKIPEFSAAMTSLPERVSLQKVEGILDLGLFGSIETFIRVIIL